MNAAGRSGLTIKARIFFGFSLILMMILILTALGVIRGNSVSNGLATIGDVNSVTQHYGDNSNRQR
jgi:methyl-accepting chemotaxis protein